MYNGPRTLRTDELKTDVVTSSGAFTMFARNFVPSGSGEYNVGATANPVSNMYVENKLYLSDQQFHVDYWEYLKYKNEYVLTGSLPNPAPGPAGQETCRLKHILILVMELIMIFIFQA